MSAAGAAVLDARRRWRRVLATIVALVLLALAVRADLEVRHSTYETRREATRVATRRAELVRRLDGARVTLAATRAQLTTDERVLATATGERDALNRALDDTAHQLTGVQGNVDGAQLQLQAANDRIEDLSRCLNGVGNALNAAAVADTRSAVRALTTVSDSCQRASGS
jgi:chromosome segregation ATPase